MCVDKLTHFTICNHFVPIVEKQCQEAATRGMACNNIRWGSLENQIEKREFTKFCPACKNILETRLEQAGGRFVGEERYGEEDTNTSEEEVGTSNKSSST
jgi:hypothetical protein